jgi:mono/diheme cytochrome c family protein
MNVKHMHSSRRHFGFRICDFGLKTAFQSKITNPKSKISLLALALTVPLLSGCNLRQVLGWDMYNQPKTGKPYRESDFFEDKLSARQMVAGTVPRRDVFADRNSTGIDFEKVNYAGDGFPDGTFGGKGSEIDDAKLKTVLERGQTVYNIYCAVCHGQTGRGDGMIVQRGFSKPPSFVAPPDGAAGDAERETLQKTDPYRWQRTQFLQTAPPRHIYNAISNGFGAMYSYGERVKPEDRWKVAAYIKTLQSTPVEARKERTPAGPPGHPSTGEHPAK